jgi:hypothetical protein
MKIFRRVLLATALLLLIALVWIWLNRPQPVDMSAYAPASALVYLESNSLMDVVDGVVSTNTWKSVRPLLANLKTDWPGARTRRLIALTGVGPTSSVILTRAQVAMVMLDLGAREEGDTMTLKPEAALLIETHTSKRRIASTVEEALKGFAEKFYTRPTLKRITIEGDEFLVWSAADSDRQIVAVIDGSLVIVGNSDRAVRACLEARRGLRPTLQSEPELQQIRTALSAQNALAFGFVPSSHAPELLALATPVALGRAPGGAQIDTLVARSAAKVLSSAGWTAKVVDGAVEDHYLITLKQSVVSRMRPAFQTSLPSSNITMFVPESARSFTLYRFNQPDQTWRELQTTLSSQLDTLSAVLLTSVLKSGLTPYGIDDPEKFLRTVGPELVTVRLNATDSGSVLVAKIRDEASLKELLRNFPKTANNGEDLELTIQYQDGYVLLGPPEDVRWCVAAAASKQDSKIKHFGKEPSAPIVTFTDDSDRVSNFANSIARANDTEANIHNRTPLRQQLQIPYSITESSLSERGLDRRTLSPFGQFSSLVPLLFPPK